MEDQKGQHIIQSLQQRWQKQVLFYSFLLALSMSVLVTAVLHKFNGVSWWLIFPVLPMVWFFILLANRNRRVKNEDVVQVAGPEFSFPGRKHRFVTAANQERESIATIAIP